MQPYAQFIGNSPQNLEKSGLDRRAFGVSSGSAGRKNEDKAGAAPLARFAPDRALMALRDLTDEREPEADSTFRAGLAEGPVEGVEDALVFPFWNAGAAILNDQLGAANPAIFL